MARQRRAPDSKSSARNRSRRAPSLREELTHHQAAAVQPADPSGTSEMANLEAQSALLSHPQLRASQRHALIAQVGRMQGDRRVQRLVASLERDEIKARPSSLPGSTSADGTVQVAPADEGGTSAAETPLRVRVDPSGPGRVAFTRPVTLEEAKEYLFKRPPSEVTAVVPVPVSKEGVDRYTRFKIDTEDLDLLYSLKPIHLFEHFTATGWGGKSIEHTHAELEKEVDRVKWLTPEVRKIILSGKVPPGITWYSGEEPGGRIILWSAGTPGAGPRTAPFTVYVYQEYPGDLEFYLGVTDGDEKTARHLLELYTDLNRDLYELVRGGTPPDLAVSRLLRIYRLVAVLTMLTEVYFTLMADLWVASTAMIGATKLGWLGPSTKAMGKRTAPKPGLGAGAAGALPTGKAPTRPVPMGEAPTLPGRAPPTRPVPMGEAPTRPGAPPARIVGPPRPPIGAIKFSPPPLPTGRGLVPLPKEHWGVIYKESRKGMIPKKLWPELRSSYMTEDLRNYRYAWESAGGVGPPPKYGFYDGTADHLVVFTVLR